MSPTAISSAEIVCTTAREPAGIVGDIEPVLNMISEMFDTTAVITRITQSTPPAASRFITAPARTDPNDRRGRCR